MTLVLAIRVLIYTILLFTLLLKKCPTYLKMFSFQIEGSVDEESTKSDEEYDDLAMQDSQECGYLSDDDEDNSNWSNLSALVNNSKKGDKYWLTLDMFLRTKSEPLSETLDSYTPVFAKSDKKIQQGNSRLRKRSLSIPTFGKHGNPAEAVTPAVPEP